MSSIMKASILSLACATLVKGQMATLVQGLVTAAGITFNDAVFGDGTNPCAQAHDEDPIGDHLNWFAGDAEETWAALCYYDTSDLEEPADALSWSHRLTPDDVAVLKCLIDLHWEQDDLCISVEGSRCEADYISTGGVIKNIRMPSIAITGGGGYTKYLSDDQWSASVKAIEWMEGQIIYVRGGNPHMHFWDYKDPDRKAYQWPRSWEINWMHGRDC